MERLREKVVDYLSVYPSVGVLRLAKHLRIPLHVLEGVLRELEREGLIEYEEEAGVVNYVPWLLGSGEAGYKRGKHVEEEERDVALGEGPRRRDVHRYARLIADFLGEEGKPLEEVARFLWEAKVPDEVRELLRREGFFRWVERDGRVYYVLGDQAPTLLARLEEDRGRREEAVVEERPRARRVTVLDFT